MKRYAAGVLISFFFAWPFCPVLAVGIGVRPTAVNLNVRAGKTVETEILVMNVSDQPALYQVYLDGLQDSVRVSPSDFQLEPQASQLITLSITVQRPGRFATNISAVARPLSASGLPAASGVKVPLTITASGIPLWWLIFGIGFTVCLVIFFMLKFRKRINQSKLNLRV